MFVWHDVHRITHSMNIYLNENENKLTGTSQMHPKHSPHIYTNTYTNIDTHEHAKAHTLAELRKKGYLL